MYKGALIAGAVFAALAVVFGAFGAHALKAVVTPDKLLVFDTGIRYQFYHSFALLITGMLYAWVPVKHLKRAAALFIAGIILFSGSLYAIVLLSISNLNISIAGILTPIGGLCFISGWILVILGISKRRNCYERV